MWRAEKSGESSFTSAGRFRIGEFAGTAIAILIGFIEQASANAAELAWSDASIKEQLTDSSSNASAVAHHVTSDGTPTEFASTGAAHNDLLSAPEHAPQSYDDDSFGRISTNADSFWFNAHGPTHAALSIRADGYSSAGENSALPDSSANIPSPSADVGFTSAASSSFQYGGPDIVDTAPGGAHSDQTPAGSSEVSIPPTTLASGGHNATEIQSIASPENNLPVDGGLDLKPAAASSGGSPAAPAGTGSGTVLEVWNGDIGSGYTNATTAGGTGSGTSNSVSGVPNAADGQGLIINVIYDASVANAPAGFTQTIANVVSFYESHFSNPVTITIDVGYGEINGQSMFPAALGESQAYMASVSYAQLQSALVANANAIGDTAAAASLAATSPVNGQYWIPTAEAQALGLAPGSGGIDGYAGFTNIPYLDYNVGNSSGTVPGSQYDFFGVVAHEFSEIMGRQMMDGEDFAGAAGYTALDLFHYSAPGIPDFSGTTPGYFSPNGGFTNLGSFNTNPYGDFGDWANSVGNNAFLAYTNPGALNPVTASDITLMNLLGWDSASLPIPPVVTAPPAHGYDSQGVAASVSAAHGVLANVTDSNPEAVMTVSTVDGSAANVGVGVSGIFGVLTLNADGSYAYDNTNPGGVTHGVAEDTFNFTVSDGQGGTANSTLTVLITSPNETLVTGAQHSDIYAPNGQTVLDGAAGGVTVIAGSGHQWLYGGPGDKLVGGTGHDNFMFAPNFGNETIDGFRPKYDVISLPSSLFANFAAIQADIQSSGANTVITLDANDAITLANFSAAHLHAHNFHFIV